MRLFPIIACTAAAPILVAAAEPVRLQPSNPWVVDYADDSCRLVRKFGEGNHEAVLAFESEAPQQMDVLVVGKALEGHITSGEHIWLRFLPMGGNAYQGRSAVSVENGAPAVLWSHVLLLPDAMADKLAKDEVEQDRISKSGVRPPAFNRAEERALKAARHEFASKTTELQMASGGQVMLETGPLGEALEVFDKCSRDSLRDWGVDPDVEDKIVKPVWAADPMKWFGANDYPRAMIAVGEESEVKVRLLVDATGRPTKCTSLSHFKAPEFNQIVCDKFMKRAHFEPAELQDGTKVPSYYVNRVVFRIAM
jgi:hypothetical protein